VWKGALLRVGGEWWFVWEDGGRVILSSCFCCEVERGGHGEAVTYQY
jgi:hypothetical protein